MQRVILTFALTGLIGTVGCAVYVRAPPPPMGVVFAVREPPPVREEIIIERPGPEHVWIGGYWGWREREYVWVPGRWEVPPRGMRRWEAGRWYHEPRGWFFVEGHWR
jgi:hypothetical protein